MPEISSHLDTLLTRWITRGSDLRKEITFQKELMDPLALAANGNRLAMRERFRRDARRLEQLSQDAQARWDERLHRIEEWGNSVVDIRDHEGQLHGIVASMLWLEKAAGHQDAFLRRLNQRADRLLQGQKALHEKLDAWFTLLQEREQILQELKHREANSKEPLYVSRARKQPEIDFVNEQRAVNETLGKDMQQLRSTLTTTLGRLQKAYSNLEERTSKYQLLYEVRKQEMVTGLKSVEPVLLDRRYQILSDALVYEACRSSLRRIHDIVRGLRCIEDLSQTPRTGWKKLFR